MSADTNHYDAQMTGLLQELWGEGYLSPGGPEEVARVLEGLDLSGMSVLDIGCGSGGVTLALVRDFGAGHVTGIDVETGVCAEASARISDAGFEDSVTIRKVAPGPLPFEAASFDFVFSKDAIIHIADKEALARDAFRVLKPGGWFAASDWLISHDETPSAEMTAYLKAEGLDFGMASPVRYEAALRDAGFTDVRTVNRNAWYAAKARAELDELENSRRADFIARVGEDFLNDNVITWRAMLHVLETGEHCPHHLRGRKP